MKKLVTFIVINLFLIGFVAAGITASAIINNSGDGNGGQNQEGIDSNENDSGNQIEANIKTQNQGEETELEIQNRIKTAFCGTSTLATCETDDGCVVGGCSNSVCQGVNEESQITTCEYQECYNAEKYNAKCHCIKNKCLWNKLTENQIKKIITARNRIRAAVAEGECPEKCTCTGSVTKCQLNNGTREMTIMAGNSGNMIVQVKGVDASTKVTLYKSEDGKVYAVTKNNETKRIRLLPDQVQEKIRERLQRQLENGEIVLNEQGIYEYRAQKRARLFFIFPVRVAVNADLDPETGKIIRLRNSWWAFLAKDEGEQIVGASCGTVTPGENDNCCMNKGYDFWNSETEECEFNIE